eukprot:2226612-Prymnesium_polylepis.1
MRVRVHARAHAHPPDAPHRLRTAQREEVARKAHEEAVAAARATAAAAALAAAEADAAEAA